MADTSSGTRKALILRVRIMPAPTRSNQRGRLCADAIKAGRDLDADAFVVVDEQGHSLTFVPVAEVLPKRLRDRRR
jgi:hypothetical protein